MFNSYLILLCLAATTHAAIEYKGCFNEDPADPELTTHLGTAADAQGCFDKCTSQGFTVAGLQAGNECWCGVSYGSKGRGTGCPCTTEQGGKATRAADSLLTLTCVYGEECCTENTAKCGACKHGMAEWQFCMLAGTDMPGCDIYCSAHPEIEGCKGGTCYRNEQSFSCQSTCPSGMRRVRYIDNWWPACDELVCEEEYACEVSESKEMCDYSDEDTNAIWSFEYFVKYGHFPHPAQQTLFEEIMASEGMEWLDIVLKEGVDTATGDFGEILKITSKLGANAGIARMTVLMAARSVAQLSTARATGRGITGAGQVLFRRALHGFWDGAARHMTHHHLKTAASVGVTLGLAVATTTAEIVAGQLVSLIGFENKQIEAAAGLLASIAAGALIGSSGAGPVGAAGGGFIGGVSWTVGQTINAIFNSGFGFSGPSDNWVYAETGYVGAAKEEDDIFFYTYNRSDKLYLVAYDRNYLGNNEKDVFSAGQAQDEDFQVEVETEYTNAAHFNYVNYRDLIRVAKSGPNSICSLHCSGEYNQFAANVPGTCTKKFADLY